jgi:hypothetical protein
MRYGMKKKTRSTMRSGALRIISVGTALALCTAGLASAAIPPDIAGKPYEPAVTALAEKNIITGDVDGNFYPDSNLTRAQICTIIVKAMQAPAAQVDGTATQGVKRSGFPDMQGYDWAEGYIAYAVEKGVVTGYPEGDFRPGNNVNMNELITMTLRAAGYSDSSLGGAWPENYISKAGDTGALAGITAPLPQSATKWMAAQLVYNVLSKIEEQGRTQASDTPSNQTSSQQGDKAAPASGDLTYVANGKFDANIFTFGGKEIAQGVEVYTYGIRADYRSDMKMSENDSDYLRSIVYKYKNVETPAWYELKDGKVSKLIIPNDVGFSGYAYGVINGIVKTSDGEDNAVDGFVTISAGRAITWLGAADLASVNVPSTQDYSKGEVYEFRLRNGKVLSVASVDGRFNTPMVAAAKEVLRDGSFIEVTGKNGNVITIGDNVVELKEQVTVYYLDEKTGKYTPASPGSVRVRSNVRLYDVSDDKDPAVDVVIVQR